MKESDLSRKIKQALQKEFHGSYWFKTAAGPYQTTGLPDIIGCVNGKFVGIEVKMPKRLDTVSVLQQSNLDTITKAGGLSFVATDAKEAVDEVKKYIGK